jgi:hypothetical protein
MIKIPSNGCLQIYNAMLDLIREPADRLIEFVVTRDERVAMTIETLSGIGDRWNVFDHLLIRAHLVPSPFIISRDRLQVISCVNKSEPAFANSLRALFNPFLSLVL